MDEGILYLPGHSRALHRQTACKVNKLCTAQGLPGEPAKKPQSATRINNHKSSKAGNEYYSNNFKLALPECFKGAPTSCSSQTVTFSLQKRD